VVAGGIFTASGTTPTLGVAKWSGAAWNAVGAGLNGNVYSLLGLAGNNLIAGGAFTASGATALGHVARWDGVAWRSLADGVDGTVAAIEIFDAQTLGVFGDFSTASGVVSAYAATFSFVGEDPVIVSQPASTAGCRGGDTQIAVTASGTAPVQYRWEAFIDGAWAALIDGERPGVATFAGTATGVLTIGSPAAVSLRVRCRVQDACAQVVSEEALFTACACLACPSDFNEDGGVDGADIEAFFLSWVTGSCDADVNQDGGTDGADVESFIVRWQTGDC
jgi:hypothetical protein